MRRKCSASPSGSAGGKGSIAAMARSMPVVKRAAGRSGMDRAFQSWTVHGCAPDAWTPCTPTTPQDTILVLGGTGKTGRRVASGSRRAACRRASARARASRRSTGRTATPGRPRSTASARSTSPTTPTSRCPARSRRWARSPRSPSSRGVPRLVLLSGRGEPEAERAEQAVRDSRRRPDDPARDLVHAELQRGLHARARARRRDPRCPAGDVAEPFVDVDDIADVAVAALTDDRHVGELYELTGPRSLTFAEAAAEISAAAGRAVRYVPVSIEQHAAEARRARRARRGRRAADVPVRRGRSTGATRTRPTASSGRSAASRATSPTTRATPPPLASSTTRSARPPERPSENGHDHGLDRTDAREPGELRADHLPRHRGADERGTPCHRP